MSTTFERPHGEEATDATPCGLSAFDETSEPQTLGSLPLGARLVIRCRKDWRTAAVAAFEVELGRVVITVHSPSGHTYRLRRPLDTPLTHEGAIPIISESLSTCWRAGLARYDVRW